MPRNPDPEDYRLLIESSWADLHHSRIQEWTALGVVAGAHLGLVQMVQFELQASIARAPLLVGAAAVIGALFTILGALITCRHRHLMMVKLRWIYLAENKLGLVKKVENDYGVIPKNAEMDTTIQWRGLAIPRPLSTSGLIFFFYVVLLFIDLAVFVTPIVYE